MINVIEAFNLFTEEYKKKYKDKKMKPGDKKFAILNNCVMMVEINENGKLNIEFSDDKPIVINESLDMYVEE